MAGRRGYGYFGVCLWPMEFLILRFTTWLYRNPKMLVSFMGALMLEISAIAKIIHFQTAIASLEGDLSND
jgi:hypothetical protein